MNQTSFQNIITEIVKQSCELKNKYTTELNAPVNYACIFSHNENEYQELLDQAKIIGNVVKETPSGLLFHIQQIDTISGQLKLLKIRIPDETRPERGDADFTVSDYPTFKNKYLPLEHFKLITRDYMEMIELMDSEFNVRTYFSDPPMDQQLGIK